VSDNGTTTGSRGPSRSAQEAAVAATHVVNQNPVTRRVSTVPAIASVARTNAGQEPASTVVFVTTTASTGGTNRGSHSQSGPEGVDAQLRERGLQVAAGELARLVRRPHPQLRAVVRSRERGETTDGVHDHVELRGAVKATDDAGGIGERPDRVDDDEAGARHGDRLPDAAHLGGRRVGPEDRDA
jgi:hypothetical protein